MKIGDLAVIKDTIQYEPLHNYIVLIESEWYDNINRKRIGWRVHCLTASMEKLGLTDNELLLFFDHELRKL